MATIRIYQGTEESFTIDATGEDGATPIDFTGCNVIFVAKSRWVNQIIVFKKTGSILVPHPDIDINDSIGEITLWIRAIDSAVITGYEEWAYYVELDPGVTGPYALDQGEVIVRPRIITPGTVSFF